MKEINELRIFHVYYLIDPRDGAVRYVGYTTNPSKRLAEHCAKHTIYWHPKDKWVFELKALGELPILEVVAQCRGDQLDAFMLETVCLHQARRLGYRLFNHIPRPPKPRIASEQWPSVLTGWASKIGPGRAHYILHLGNLTACRGTDSSPGRSRQWSPFREKDHLCEVCQSLYPKECLCDGCRGLVKSLEELAHEYMR